MAKTSSDMNWRDNGLSSVICPQPPVWAHWLEPTTGVLATLYLPRGHSLLLSILHPSASWSR